jgi:NADPH:quinone reductase-like Zn-dependent oxidoreductase
MSSWLSLTKRANLTDGESVPINGVTDIPGQIAVQIAKYLGAKTIIETGRNPELLKTLLHWELTRQSRLCSPTTIWLAS